MRGLPSALLYMITVNFKAKIFTTFFTTNQFVLKRLNSITNKERSLKLYQSSVLQHDVLQHDVLQQRHPIAAAIRKRAYAVSVGISSKPSLVKV